MFLLMIALFLPYWILFQMVPTVWWLAGRIFGPRNLTVPPSRPLDIVQTVRTFGGLALSIGVYWYFTGLLGMEELVLNGVRKSVWTAAFGFVAVIVALIVLVAVTRSELRRTVARRLWQPFITFGAVLGLLGMCAWTLFLPGRLFGGDEAPLLFGLMYSLPAMLLLFVFLPRAVFLIGKNLFNAADVHPMLPALVTIPLTWFMYWVDTTQASILSDGPSQTVGLAGTIPVTVLSLVELRYLRRQGVSLRSGPYPRPAPDAADRPEVVAGSR